VVLLTTVKKAVLSACQMGLAFWKLSNAVGPVTGFCNCKSESRHAVVWLDTDIQGGSQMLVDLGSATANLSHDMQLCGQTQTHRQTGKLSDAVGPVTGFCNHT